MGYAQDLVAHFDLSVDNPPDICWRGNRYPGAGANIVGHPNSIAGGRCAEFNGVSSNINMGDVLELNTASAFTIAFWMNQDVLDQLDIILVKNASGGRYLQFLTHVAGTLSLEFGYGTPTLANARFDYSLFVSAGEWHHIVAVFDGSGAANADRAKVYIDGNPITLTFTGSAIQATTADLSGADLIIGSATIAFDGKLDEFVILSAALTQIQVNDLMIRQRQGRF